MPSLAGIAIACMMTLSEQSPARPEATLESWRALARHSTLVAEVTVTRASGRFVIDPRRRPSGRRYRPDGTSYSAPQLIEDYAVGALLTVRLDTIIRSRGGRAPNTVIDVFTDGSYPPRFEVGDRLLAFLVSPVELIGETRKRYNDWKGLSGTTVTDLDEWPEREVPFDPVAVYSLTTDFETPPTLDYATDQELIQVIVADLQAGDFQAYLMTPRNGSDVTGVVELSAGSIGRPLVAVQYQLDGVNLGEQVTASPFVRSWDTSSVETGRHELRAVARDSSGGIATSPLVEAIVQRTLRVADAVISEGNAGAKDVAVAVELSAPTSATVMVEYVTSSVTAEADSDYSARSGTLEFPPGQTLKAVTVPVKGDLIAEENESFLVDLGQVMGAVIADAAGRVTIEDDDAPLTCPAAVAPGAVFTTTIRAGSSDTDWVATYPADQSSHTPRPGPYRYVGLPRPAGVSLSAPGAPGTYELRLFANDGYDVMASCRFEVSP